MAQLLPKARVEMSTEQSAGRACCRFCNTLLHFMKAMDTALAMGAGEAKRMGYVLSKPEAASRCISIIGDGLIALDAIDLHNDGFAVRCRFGNEGFGLPVFGA